MTKSIIQTIMIYVLHILLLVAVVACETETDKVTISKTEYEKLKGDTLKSEYPKPFKLYTEGLSYLNNNGIVLGSDNHEYLVVYYSSNGCNVEHYIDCKLCKERSNQ